MPRGGSRKGAGRPNILGAASAPLYFRIPASTVAAIDAWRRVSPGSGVVSRSAVVRLALYEACVHVEGGGSIPEAFKAGEKGTPHRNLPLHVPAELRGRIQRAADAAGCSLVDLLRLGLCGVTGHPAELKALLAQPSGQEGVGG